MKRIITANLARLVNRHILAVVLFAAMLLVGCSNEIPENTEHTPESSTSPTVTSGTTDETDPVIQTEPTILPTENTTGEVLPQISYRYVSNGFLIPEGGVPQYVIYVANGVPEIALLSKQWITVEHNGSQTEVGYYWCRRDDQLLAVTEPGAGYSVEAIGVNSHYLVLTFGSQSGTYAYLIDTQTNAILDPLARVEQKMVDTISQIYFSADGKHALLNCDGGDTWRLLECESGNTVLLDEVTGMSQCSGMFLDENSIKIHTNGDSEVYVYDLGTGECTLIAESSADEKYMVFTSECKTKIVNNLLTVVDTATGEETATQFSRSAVDEIYPGGRGSIIVISDGILYVISSAGDVQTVCTVS